MHARARHAGRVSHPDPRRRPRRSPGLLLAAAVVFAGLPAVGGPAPPPTPQLSPAPFGGESSGGDPLELLRSALLPAAAQLFDAIHADLAPTAVPFPDPVIARLRPFFADLAASDRRSAAEWLRSARYVVDPPRTRELFALAPTGIEAITVHDIVVFAPGRYRPDCIEGVALIGHELAHVRQWARLGRMRFLEEYFLTETLMRLLAGGLAGGEVALEQNRLEIEAYCAQAGICGALAREGALAACDGAPPRCPPCPAPRPAASPVEADRDQVALGRALACRAQGEHAHARVRGAERGP